jgi:hypothetical protein
MTLHLNRTFVRTKTTWVINNQKLVIYGKQICCVRLSNEPKPDVYIYQLHDTVNPKYEPLTLQDNVSNIKDEE